uniref:Uncharacterized protein n=1 Tax=Mastacembelus armatus TaxID=205130 RepID=A0A3Q3RZ44_9TELE
MKEALRHALPKHFPQFSGVRNKKQTAALHNLLQSHFEESATSQDHETRQDKEEEKKTVIR